MFFYCRNKVQDQTSDQICQHGSSLAPLQRLPKDGQPAPLQTEHHQLRLLVLLELCGRHRQEVLQGLQGAVQEESSPGQSGSQGGQGALRELGNQGQEVSPVVAVVDKMFYTFPRSASTDLRHSKTNK